MAYSIFIVSIVAVNILTVLDLEIILISKDNKLLWIIKKIQLVLLVSEGESKNYNLKERATQIYYEKGL